MLDGEQVMSNLSVAQAGSVCPHGASVAGFGEDSTQVVTRWEMQGCRGISWVSSRLHQRGSQTLKANPSATYAPNCKASSSGSALQDPLLRKLNIFLTLKKCIKEFLYHKTCNDRDIHY